MKGSRSIKAFFFDVDGTLTSGTLILGTKGEAYKIFHAQNGEWPWGWHIVWDILPVLLLGVLRILSVCGRRN